MTELATLEKLVDASPKLQEAIATIFSEVKRLTTSENEAVILFQEILKISPGKPRGWSSSSNTPYYCKEYGEWLKKELERLESAKPAPIFLSKAKLKRSNATAYILVNQAWLWLCERAEDAERWQKLRREVEVKKEATGLLFRWKDALGEGVVLEGETKEAKTWKGELIEYAENGPKGKKFVLENLELSAEHISWILELSNQHDFIILSIGKDKLEVVRMP